MANRRVIAAAGLASMGAAVQGQPIAHYVETSVVPAPELQGVVPAFERITESGLLFGSFRRDGDREITTFVQRLDGGGYAEFENFWLSEANDAGFIVGMTGDPDQSSRRARLFDPSIGVIEIQTPGLDRTRLVDISDGGVAVGSGRSVTDSGVATTRPFVYDGTGFRELELPASANGGIAMAISPNGRLIAGVAFGNGEDQSRVVYWEDEALVETDIVAFATAGMDLNNAGLVDLQHTPFAEPVRSAYFDLFTGEGGYAAFSPDIPAGVGITTEGVSFVRGAYGGAVGGSSIGFVFDGELFGAEQFVEGDLAGLSALDISRNGGLLLARSATGDLRAFRAIPTPASIIVVGVGAVLATRRCR